MRALIKTEVVQALLLERNISQNGLARLSVVSQGYLSQVLSKQRSPGPAVRKRLMRTLKVRKFDDLFEVVP